MLRLGGTGAGTGEDSFLQDSKIQVKNIREKHMDFMGAFIFNWDRILSFFKNR
jgi:hypothetical protein